MASLEAVKAKSGRTFYRIVYMWNGQRKRIKVGVTSHAIAKQRKVQIEALLGLGKNPEIELEQKTISDGRVSDFLALDSAWAEGRMQPHTLRINSWALGQLIKWGKDPRMNEVDRRMIEKFITHLHQELGRSETTVNMIVRQLKAAFQRAVDEHSLLTDHPFRTIKLLSQPKQGRKPNYLTVEQIKALVEGISNEHFKRLVCFYLWTGCRRTEALELRWDEVDWQHGIFYLGQASSKTKIRRAIPIGENVKLLLDELKGDKGENELVFWRYSSNVSHISNLLGNSRKGIDGLPETLTTHSLRHTFASHLVMAGVDIMTVASLLGHTTSKTTELYAHLLPQHKKQSIERLPY